MKRQERRRRAEKKKIQMGMNPNLIKLLENVGGGGGGQALRLPSRVAPLLPLSQMAEGQNQNQALSNLASAAGGAIGGLGGVEGIKRYITSRYGATTAQEVPSTLVPPTFERPVPPTYQGSFRTAMEGGTSEFNGLTTFSEGATVFRPQVEGGTTATLPRMRPMRGFRPPAESVPANAEEGIRFAEEARNLPLPEEFRGSDLMSSGASSGMRTIPTAEGTFLRTAVPERATINQVFAPSIEQTSPPVATAERAMPINVNQSPYDPIDRMLGNIRDRWSQFQNNRAQQALQAERQRIGARVAEPQGIEMSPYNSAYYDRLARFQRGEITSSQVASEVRQERQMANARPRPFGEGETQESMVGRGGTALEQQGAGIRAGIRARGRAPVRQVSETEQARLEGEVRGRYGSFLDNEFGTETTATSSASTARLRRMLGVDSEATTSSAITSGAGAGGRMASMSQVETMGEEMTPMLSGGMAEEGAGVAEEAVSAEAVGAGEAIGLGELAEVAVLA